MTALESNQSQSNSFIVKTNTTPTLIDRLMRFNHTTSQAEITANSILFAEVSENNIVAI